MAVILIFRGANLKESDTFEKLVQIISKTNILDEDHVKAIVSRGSELPGYRKCFTMLKSMVNISLIREAIEKHLISSIEKKEEENDIQQKDPAPENKESKKYILQNNGHSTNITDGLLVTDVVKSNKYPKISLKTLI